MRFSVLRTMKNDLRRVPSVVTALFCVSVIVMNLLANKTIYQSETVAVDGGILISWLAFMCMDIVTKAFGPGTANTVSVFALLTNLFVSLVFYLVSIIPTETDYTAFNTIFGGTWFILLSSSIAFITSAFINNFTNAALGRLFRRNPDGKLAFAVRSYGSTVIGQLWDNFVFVALTFRVFAPVYWNGFSWTWTQCLTCSLIGAGLELVTEILFSPFGYMILRRWKEEGICGAEGKVRA